jgi:hypothetical protein
MERSSIQFVHPTKKLTKKIRVKINYRLNGFNKNLQNILSNSYRVHINFISM